MNNYGLNINNLLEFDKPIDSSSSINGLPLLLRPLPYAGGIGNTNAFNKFTYKQSVNDWKELSFTPKLNSGQLLYSRDFNGLSPYVDLYKTNNLKISVNFQSIKSKYSMSSSGDDDLTDSEIFLNSLTNPLVCGNMNFRKCFRLILGGGTTTIGKQSSTYNDTSYTNIFGEKIIDANNPSTKDQYNGFLSDMTDYKVKTPIENYQNFEKSTETIRRYHTQNLGFDKINMKNSNGFNSIIDYNAWISDQDPLDTLYTYTKNNNQTYQAKYYFVEINFQIPVSLGNRIQGFVPVIRLGYHNGLFDQFFDETQQILDPKDCLGNLCLSFYDVEPEIDNDENTIITITDSEGQQKQFKKKEINYNSFSSGFDKQLLDDKNEKFNLILAYRFTTITNKTYYSTVKLKINEAYTSTSTDRMSVFNQSKYNSIGHFGLMYNNLPKFSIGNLEIAQRTQDSPFESCQPPQRECRIYLILAPDTDKIIKWDEIINEQLIQLNNIYKRLNLKFIIADKRIVSSLAIEWPDLRDRTNTYRDAYPWRYLAAHRNGFPVSEWIFDVSNTLTDITGNDFIKILLFYPNNFYNQMAQDRISLQGLGWGEPKWYQPNLIPDDFNQAKRDTLGMADNFNFGYAWCIPTLTTIPHEISHVFTALHIFENSDIKNLDRYNLMQNMSKGGQYIDPVNFIRIMQAISSKLPATNAKSVYSVL